MSVSITGRATIIDRLIPRSITADIALVLAGAGLTAAAAQVVIPMWPVPVTGQTFAVLLVGAVLGSLRGGLSMAVYVLAGALGAPIFTEGKSGWVFGPTLGYLIGFVAAAAIVGFFTERELGRKWFTVAVGLVLGNAAIYAFGLPWLAIFLGAMGYPNDLLATASAGLAPFLAGDAIKIAVAATLIPGAWKLVSKIKR